MKRLGELGHEIVPLAWAAAAPASYVTEDAYENMWALFDEDLRHRGRSTRSISTCTARWSRRTPRTAKASCCAASAHRRRRPADRRQPRLSRQLHAGDGEAADRAGRGYRTYPHIDMAVTGKRARRSCSTGF